VLCLVSISFPEQVNRSHRFDRACLPPEFRKRWCDCFRVSQAGTLEVSSWQRLLNFCCPIACC
jgi:hypothetical protein